MISSTLATPRTFIIARSIPFSIFHYPLLFPVVIFKYYFNNFLSVIKAVPDIIIIRIIIVL